MKVSHSKYRECTFLVNVKCKYPKPLSGRTRQPDQVILSLSSRRRMAQRTPRWRLTVKSQQGPSRTFFLLRNRATNLMSIKLSQMRGIVRRKTRINTKARLHLKPNYCSRFNYRLTFPCTLFIDYSLMLNHYITIEQGYWIYI